MLEQTKQAKADVEVIRKYVLGVSGKKWGYAHYTVKVSCDAPEGWDAKRVGDALIDYVDGGWSPFGGHAVLGLNGEYFVKVYTD